MTMPSLPHRPVLKSGATGGPRPVASLVSRKVAHERLMADIERLPALPSVVTDVMQMANDPDATVAELEQLISRDPVMTARIFKLANSTFYSRGTVAATIHDALKRLGFNTIKHLALAAGAGTLLVRPLTPYHYTASGLWQHSLGLALVARTLARHLHLRAHVGDELFLAGLMHDIGKLVLAPLLGDNDSAAGRLTTDIESDLLGHTHTEVGAQIATMWNLPAATISVIAQHHAVDSTSDYAQHTAVIHVADAFINHAHIGFVPDTEVEQDIDPVALELLNLDDESVIQLEEDISADLPAILQMCEELMS